MSNELSSVTLIAVDGRASGADGAAWSLKRAEDAASSGGLGPFGQVVLVHWKTSLDFPHWRTVRLPKPLSSLEEYSHFCLYRMASLVDTSHALVIQADSFIANAGAWHKDFLKFDYIGAPWAAGTAVPEHPHPVVGNGGFSLRSKRLLDLLPQLPDKRGTWSGRRLENTVEDLTICITGRKWLQEQGMVFAPVDVAQRFSFEYPTAGCPRYGGQFGVHLPH